MTQPHNDNNSGTDYNTVSNADNVDSIHNADNSINDNAAGATINYVAPANEAPHNLVVTKEDTTYNNSFIYFGLPAIFFVSMLVFSVFAIPFINMDTGEMNIIVALLLSVLTEVITIFIYLAVTKKWIPLNFKEKLGLQNFKFKNVAWSAVAGFVMFVLLQLAVYGLSALTGQSTDSSDTSTSIFESSGFTRWFALAFLTPFVAPIIEELLFRGAIFNGLLLGNANKKLAFIFSAFAFAVVHIQGFDTITDWFTIGWIFLIALTQCHIFYRTRSIYNTMAFHVFYNGSTVIISLLLIPIAS